MIRCGLSKDVGGVRKILQFSREIQDMDQKYPPQFNEMSPLAE